ncbi:MAG: STAS domain-containing protein [Burkholderiaceae bacterium]|nr:STAS domain-containing protein [Burkholderiaceae bacterium]
MLVLPAEITQAQAVACLTMLQTAARAGGDCEVVIDAAPLERFDSSALAVLLQCRRESLAGGKSFAVTSMPPRLAELAALYGVAPLLWPKEG